MQPCLCTWNEVLGEASEKCFQIWLKAVYFISNKTFWKKTRRFLCGGKHGTGHVRSCKHLKFPEDLLLCNLGDISHSFLIEGICESTNLLLFTVGCKGRKLSGMLGEGQDPAADEYVVWASYHLTLVQASLRWHHSFPFSKDSYFIPIQHEVKSWQ